MNNTSKLTPERYSTDQATGWNDITVDAAKVFNFVGLKFHTYLDFDVSTQAVRLVSGAITATAGSSDPDGLDLPPGTHVVGEFKRIIRIDWEITA